METTPIVYWGLGFRVKGLGLLAQGFRKSFRV